MINYETKINLIGGTKTRTGLRVKAVMDTNEYEIGIKVSDEEIEKLRLQRHKVHPAGIIRSHPASARNHHP